MYKLSKRLQWVWLRTMVNIGSFWNILIKHFDQQLNISIGTAHQIFRKDMQQIISNPNTYLFQWLEMMITWSHRSKCCPLLFSEEWGIQKQSTHSRGIEKYHYQNEIFIVNAAALCTLMRSVVAGMATCLTPDA